MHAMRKLAQMPMLISCALSLLGFGAIMGLRFAGVLVSLELTAYDWLHMVRPTVTVQAVTTGITPRRATSERL